jgi:hypothetical protein
VLDHCKERRTYSYVYPNATLQPDYDLIEEIHQVHKSYNIVPTFRWVKGHQDAKKPYEELSIDAQLNVTADELATAYRDQYGRYEPFVPVNHISQANITIQGRTLTSHYTETLHNGATEAPYLQYVQNKFGWSNTIVNDIHWHGFAQAVNQLDHLQTFIVKLCNDLTPCGSELHRRDSEHNPACVLCGAEETQCHILRCTHDTRINWRRAFVKEVRTSLRKSGTDDGFIDCFASCLSEWLQEGCVTQHKYPMKYHLAIHMQSLIGWRQVFAGKLSQEWLVALQQPDNSTPVGRDQATNWISSLIQRIIRSTYTLWELRNEDVHGHTEHEKKVKERERYIKSIIRLHHDKNLARPSDEFLFVEDVDTFVSDSTTRKLKNWIATYRPAIMHSIKEAAASAVTNTKTILHYFGYADPEAAARKKRQRRERLQYDSQIPKKKRRCLARDDIPSTGYQATLLQFISPMVIDDPVFT